MVLVASSMMTACSHSDSAKFATDAVQGGMTQVELGKLAIERGSSSVVRSFGEQMVADHEKANDELKNIAAKNQISLPDGVSSAQQATIEKLSKLSGAEFDKQYMSDMVSDHQAVAKAFEEQAQQGTNADVKAFAARTLPTVQRHLNMARDAATQIASR